MDNGVKKNFGGGPLACCLSNKGEQNRWRSTWSSRRSRSHCSLHANGLQTLSPAVWLVLFIFIFGTKASVESRILGDVSRLTSRQATVADAIRMTSIVDPSPFFGKVKFSPDGSRVVLVVKKGNIEQNLNEFSILVLEVMDVFNS